MFNNTDSKNQIWQVLFFVLPVLILSRIGDIYADNFIHKLLLSAIGGVFGVGIGVLVYHFVENKNIITKGISAVILVGICIGSIVGMTMINRPVYSTCEICGYQAILSDIPECGICDNIPWEKEDYGSEYSKKEDWLKDEQLYFFDDDVYPISFYAPGSLNDYKKDESWKPVITEQELKDYQLQNNDSI